MKNPPDTRPNRNKQWQAALLTAALVLLASCTHRHKTAHVPKPPSQTSGKGHGAQERAAGKNVSVGYTEQGIASWYGVPYHGRPAADGEIYDMETMVAAHRLMPFNTWLRVTNLASQKSVEVRVIDRGPFVDGRIIDLSKAAARQIDLLGPGIGKVRIEVISAPTDIASNDFYGVQIGAFAVRANAERLRVEYATRFGNAQIAAKQGDAILYRVLVGRERTIENAQRIANDLLGEGKSAFVVRLDETVTGAAGSGSPTQLHRF